MAGALTANTIVARVDDGVAGADAAPIADVSNLSPVEGANNVLLTGVVVYIESDEPAELTFQWVRSSIGSSVPDDAIGAAVGDPFVVDTADTELGAGPIVVQAIDRGPGLTSAYALTVIGDPVAIIALEAIYADAVTYD